MKIGRMLRVNAETIAQPFRDEITSKIKSLKENHGIVPLLIGFLANDDAGAVKYAEWTKKACEKDGINFEIRNCTAYELESKLNIANMDPSVHGILIYYPCFGSQPSFYGGTMDDFLRDSVRPEKDVEGLCYTYRTNLYHDIRFIKTLDGRITNKKCLLPCTPLAIVKALESLGLYNGAERMKGKVVTIINRSDIVGRPLSAMLANDLAEVYSIDINSIFIMKDKKMLPTEVTLEEAVRKSDVIITGVPSKAYQLNTDFIKKGAVLINVSHFKNVNEDELKEVDDVKYVPLIGKVTVAMLERNLLRLIDNFHLPGQKATLIEAGGRLDPNYKESDELAS